MSPTLAYRITLAIGVLAVLLTALSFVSAEWIEALGLHPDGGDGSLERSLPWYCLAVAVTVGVAALAQRRRLA